MGLTVRAYQWLIFAIAMLILGSVIAYNQCQDYLRIGAQEDERLAAMADIVGKNVVPQLVLADHIITNILSDLPSWHAANDDFKLANRQLKIINDTINGIPPLLVLDASGAVIVSSDPKLLGMNFAYREYFKTAVKNPDPRILHVSAPFKTVLDDFAFTLLRTIKGPKGEFAGIVVVTEVPAYFRNLLDSVRYAPDVRTFITHGDGEIFLASPQTDGLEGKDLAKPGTLFTRHRESGQEATVFTGNAYATGGKRRIAQRSIQLTTPAMDKPLIVGVSRDLESIFGSWHKGAFIQGGLFGALVLVTGLGLYLYQKRQQVYDRLVISQEAERKLGEASLRESEERNRTLLAVSPDGIWMHHNARIEYANDALVRMLGYASARDLVGRTVYEFFVPEFRDSLRERVAKVVTTLESAPLAETAMLRSDGSRLEVETSATGFLQGETVWNISIIRDITERKRAEQRIERLAFFDQLTGLANRTLLLDRLNQAIAASSRSGQHGALLFIDLDNFKTLNDTLGHDMGDVLLKQVAQRLLDCVREGDTVARVGGDEFLVVLAGLSSSEEYAATDIETVTEKILASLNQPYQLGQVPHRSTASIGVTLFNGDSTAIDDLMKQADLAMYKAKDAGRNIVHFFDPTLESAVKERAALDDDLRRALVEKQFLLYYQAQVDGNGCCTGAEALIRWQHPLRGMVSPANFIPLTEETGLILPLGQWVMETACMQLATWAGKPATADLTLSVNLSARQFYHRDFVAQVLAVLEHTNANPKRLKLELTESLLVDDVEAVIAKMNALQEVGVRFSLDDFGTGYSSLSSLKRLPLDQLKIDQSFVRDILTDPNDAAIAKMIVALAESMGLTVIAEGVEIEAQRDFLARHGCHAYQGYLFSRPLALEGFEEFVGRVQTTPQAQIEFTG